MILLHYQQLEIYSPFLCQQLQYFLKTNGHMGGCVYGQTKIMDVANPQALKPEQESILKSNVCNNNASSGKAATIILTAKEGPKQNALDIQTSLVNVSRNSLPPIKVKQHSARPFSVVIRELVTKSKKGTIKLKDDPLSHSNNDMRSSEIQKQERIQIGHPIGGSANPNFQLLRV